jgi:hypothetical protein
LLKRLAAVAALLVVPAIATAPVDAAPYAPVQGAASEATDEEEEDEEDDSDGASLAINPADVGTFGYAVGVDPLNSWQFSNAFYIRHSPWGDWSEAMLGVNTRSQVIDPTGAYALEFTGLNAQLGVKAWFLRLGLSGEIDWVKRITQNAGRLSWQNSPGFLVEPYVGTTLPFFRTPFTSLDARVYVPVARFVPGAGFLSPDPAIGPRLMLNLWVGLPDTPDDEFEEEEEEEEEDTESMDDEETEEEAEEEAVPAPAPRATPAPKVTPKPAPKAPAKPQPKK